MHHILDKGFGYVVFSTRVCVKAPRHSFPTVGGAAGYKTNR